MKTIRALEIAKKIDNYVRDYGCSNGTINLLDDLIDELESLENKSCERCKYSFDIFTQVDDSLLGEDFICTKLEVDKVFEKDFYCSKYEPKQ